MYRVHNSIGYIRLDRQVLTGSAGEFGALLAFNSQPLVFWSYFLGSVFGVARLCLIAAEPVSYYEQW